MRRLIAAAMLALAVGCASKPQPPSEEVTTRPSAVDPGVVACRQLDGWADYGVPADEFEREVVRTGLKASAHPMLRQAAAAWARAERASGTASAQVTEAIDDALQVCATTIGG
jgi:hypothetical protein